jgi:hypothetical protein
MRYAARWDDARGGYGIFDVEGNTWVPNSPAFARPHIAGGLARALDEWELAQDICRCLEGLRRLLAA